MTSPTAILRRKDHPWLAVASLIADATYVLREKRLGVERTEPCERDHSGVDDGPPRLDWAKARLRLKGQFLSRVRTLRTAPWWRNARQPKVRAWHWTAYNRVVNSGRTVKLAVTVEQLWQRIPGGSGTYVRELVRALTQAGDVDAVGIAAYHRSTSPAPGLPIEVHHSFLPRRLLFDSWHAARRPRSSVPRGSDVIHATTWAIPPRTAPLVVTVHDLAFLRAPEHFTSRGNRFFRRGLEIVAAEADIVLTPSRLTAADCIDHGIEANRVRVIPLAARVPAVSPEQVSAIRRRYALEREYVLWCGTLEPRKNLPGLLRAFDLVAARENLDLVLVGPSGWGSVDPAALAGRSRERVKILGRLSGTELHAAYAGARSFAFPSTWEGFGLPVLEAMAHGVPVVTSRGTSMAEFSGDAAILVDPDDVDELAEAIIRASGPDHERMSERGRSIAAAYTWGVVARQTAAAYRELT